MRDHCRVGVGLAVLGVLLLALGVAGLLVARAADDSYTEEQQILDARDVDAAEATGWACHDPTRIFSPMVVTVRPEEPARIPPKGPAVDLLLSLAADADEKVERQMLAAAVGWLSALTAQLDDDGPVVRGSKGQVRPHPLLVAEAKLRAEVVERRARVRRLRDDRWAIEDLGNGDGELALVEDEDGPVGPRR